MAGKSKTTAVVTEESNAVNLPEPVARRGINEAQWRTLSQSLYPGAQSQSVLMVWDYCKARKLDPMKKPCHIVPMKVKDAKTGNYEWRDVVMPGIYEYRTTAQRTGEYLGHSKPEYGPMMTAKGDGGKDIEVPEFCEMVIYRWNPEARQKVEYPVIVYFGEIAATTKEGTLNQRWTKAPIQMLTKCTEAAGLREAFPDELGGEPTVEEMEGKDFIEAEFTERPAGKPATQAPKRKAAEPTFEAEDENQVTQDGGSDDFVNAYNEAEGKQREPGEEG